MSYQLVATAPPTQDKTTYSDQEQQTVMPQEGLGTAIQSTRGRDAATASAVLLLMHYIHSMLIILQTLN
jgi:hypothetical protein